MAIPAARSRNKWVRVVSIFVLLFTTFVMTDLWRDHTILRDVTVGVSIAIAYSIGRFDK